MNSGGMVLARVSLSRHLLIAFSVRFSVQAVGNARTGSRLISAGRLGGHISDFPLRLTGRFPGFHHEPCGTLDNGLDNWLDDPPAQRREDHPRKEWD